MTKVDQHLGSVDTTALQSVLAEHVEHLHPDPVFQHHKTGYYRRIYARTPNHRLTDYAPPFVLKSTANGSCAFNSSCLALTAQQQTGEPALRFRTALFLTRHYDQFLQHAYDGTANPDELAQGYHALTPTMLDHDISRAVESRGWQSMVGLAAISSTLGCAIHTYYPGAGVFGK
jgi:hypothetical protein